MECTQITDKNIVAMVDDTLESFLKAEKICKKKTKKKHQSSFCAAANTNKKAKQRLVVNNRKQNKKRLTDNLFLGNPRGVKDEQYNS